MATQQGYPAVEAPRDGTIIQMLQTDEDGNRYGVAIHWREVDDEEDRKQLIADGASTGSFYYVDRSERTGDPWVADQDDFRWLADPFASTEKP